MMKKILYSINIVIIGLCLCGFVAGVEIGDPEDNQPSEPTSPVLEYTDTIAPSKSSQELYKEYHLLAISSLDEAESSFQENQLWTYRMVHNAANYIKLLNGLVMDAQKQEYLEIIERFQPILVTLKNKNLQKYQLIKIQDELKDIAKTLEQDYSWEKAKAWIKE